MRKNNHRIIVVGLVLLRATVGGGSAAAPAMTSVTSTPAASDRMGGWVGRTAPAFTLPDSHGEPVDMSRVFGTRPVVLIFYRGVWCPFCQAQMTQIGKDRDAFIRSGAAIYAVSDEDPPAQKKMQDAHGLDFVTFLSDKAGAAARQYAGVYPGRTTLKPGVFVVGRDKKIRYAYANENYRLRAEDRDVLAAIHAAAR